MQGYDQFAYKQMTNGASNEVLNLENGQRITERDNFRYDRSNLRRLKQTSP
jgi:hypothetical protein